jgi:hypothetical protein
MLLVEDQVDLEVIRTVMGDSFGVGVRKVVRTGDGVAPLVIADRLNAVWPPTREEMQTITAILGKSHKTDEECVLCRRKRDKIVFRYDPLLSKCFITIVYTPLVIGENDDAMHVLRSINHNVMVDLLTAQQCVIAPYSKFSYNGKEYFATHVDGSMVSGEDTDGVHRITAVHASLCTIINN